MKDDFSCKCDNCKGACEHKPGWFLPDQVEAVLDHFKVKHVDDLLGQQLAIDWYINDGLNVLVLSPQVESNKGSIQFPGDPQGVCVFYKRGLCEIYDVRPFECRKLNHDNEQEDIDERHRFTSESWDGSDILKKYEGQIDCESYTIFDHLVGGFYQ